MLPEQFRRADVRRSAIIALMCVAFAGCASHRSTEPTASVTKYELSSLDGSPLPIVLSDSSAGQLISGSLTLFDPDSARIEDRILVPASGGHPPITLVQIGDYAMTKQGATDLLSPRELSSGVDTLRLAVGEARLSHTIRTAGILKTQLRDYRAP